MDTKKAKRGETATRIYKLLHRNPDLTTNEIASHLPDVSPAIVQMTVSRMRQRGQLESRGRKVEQTAAGKLMPYRTYHVKYNSRPAPKPKKKPKVQAAPKVEVPKPVVDTQPVWQPPVAKPEPEGPKTPVAEREVLMLRHLTDIYRALSLMTEQQDTLIEVLKGTLADLAETKEELDRERQRRNWWDKIKDLFA